MLEGLTINNTTYESVIESDADENTRVVFEDIKSTMGVALVNQVWRRFAVVPSVLHACWQTLKPCYQNDSILTAAWQLREQIDPLEIDPINSVEIDTLKHELKDAAVIDDVLRTYERGNAQNLVALCLLQKTLDSVTCPVENQDAGSDQAKVIRLDENQSAGQQADAVFSDIPDIPRLEALPEDIQCLVARSSLTWVPSRYTGLQPTVFRHLSCWPGLLTLFTDRLETIERGPKDTIYEGASRALNSAKHHALQLSAETNRLAKLNSADQLWLNQELQVFIDVVLARGVVIVPTLRSLI